ncbi:MAG: response regulator [Armatimonadetes bacterium]|nr:response regulator [Armatimonadota bacterium]
MITALVVDDEPMLTDLVKSVLEDAGCTVHCAANGVEALQIMAQGPVDILLTDVHMPQMSGFELINRVRSQHPNVVIVVMDSYPDSFTDSFSMEGVRQIVSKPFELETIRQVVLEMPQGSWQKAA